MTYTIDLRAKSNKLKQQGRIVPDEFSNKHFASKKVGMEELAKKLQAAKKKVQELRKQKYPDQDKIERAELIVARLQETLQNEGR